MRYSSKQTTEDVQGNMSLTKIKKLKANIRENGSIKRELGSKRHQKLFKAHWRFILKLISDYPYNTWNRIVDKLWNKHGVKVGRTTILSF